MISNKLLTLSALTLTFSYAHASPLSTTEQKASYAIGVDLATNLKNQAIDIQVDPFLLGLEDTLKNNELKLTSDQMNQSLDDFRASLEAKQQANQKALADQNKKAGESFLAQNKTKPDIKTMESGLQYRVIEEGKGAHPTENDTIIAHYKGTLLDGTEFDSSYNRNAPIEFKMNNVILGWQQALKVMKPGSKWEIFVPADLAYGTRGAGNVIGPNQTLIFEIHFIATAAE
ncbi:MAG: FKBP-type peptidyl-prolyl cis-trans isomerase [Thiomicrospira sp.]|uniref:FKBP-type peptidyl-prolyl cis-trans isomerase n=1 Tax=Thiomicrospira sp. TaxID=935 RepID=UPI0019FDAC3A|nr:FKBP-type peptidyl-prolyl cis-trans isomerase [Thiomicrospira sp.]MBE0494241.1 FKBP-type peptidyl-prolyl cis-trans isomerase [Thiomicrospira sp.]